MKQLFKRSRLDLELTRALRVGPMSAGAAPGPLHADALGRLTSAWPLIIPPAPGMLCAHGDAPIHGRTRLEAGNCMEGSAVGAQMDTTTLVLPGPASTVDAAGTILLRPVA